MFIPQYKAEYDKWTILLVAMAIQLIFLFIMPITTTLDSTSYADLILGRRSLGGGALFMFPFIGRLVGTKYFADLTTLMSVQAFFAVLMPLLLYLAISPLSRLAGWIATLLFIISLNPFFYSTWLMLEHIYMFAICLVIFAYSRVIYAKGEHGLAFLMFALWFAYFSRVNGAYLLGILLCSLLFLAFFAPWVRQKKFLIALTKAVSIFLIAVAATSIYARNQFGNTPSTMSARFLFCNIYGHAKEGPHGERLQLTYAAANPILDAVKTSLTTNPELLNTFAKRWPDLMGKYAQNHPLFLQDLRANKDGGPTMHSTNHLFCWYIMQALDATHTPYETNLILKAAWQEALFHQHYGWRHYVQKFFGYFFVKPDNYYHGVDRPFPPQINANSIPASIYAQIGYITSNPILLAIIVWINKYWLAFMLKCTPYFAFFSFLAIPFVFSAYARNLLIFLLGIIFSHALINAVTNTTDVRYIAVIYPAMCSVIGLLIANIFYWYLRYKSAS